jgi:hypothetical protein
MKLTKSTRSRRAAVLEGGAASMGTIVLEGGGEEQVAPWWLGTTRRQAAARRRQGRRQLAVMGNPSVRRRPLDAAPPIISFPVDAASMDCFRRLLHAPF